VEYADDHLMVAGREHYSFATNREAAGDNFRSVFAIAIPLFPAKASPDIGDRPFAADATTTTRRSKLSFITKDLSSRGRRDSPFGSDIGKGVQRLGRRVGMFGHVLPYDCKSSKGSYRGEV